MRSFCSLPHFINRQGKQFTFFQRCLIFLCFLHGSFLTSVQWKTALTRFFSKPEINMKTLPATSCAHSFAFIVYLPNAKRSSPIRNNLSLKSCGCLICILGISILTRLTYCMDKVPCADCGFWRCPLPSFVISPWQQDREGPATKKHLRFLTSLRVTLAGSGSSALSIEWETNINSNTAL